MKTTTFHTLIKNYEIRIPLIQRDYAQGREDARSRRVRRDFLRALKEALTSEKPLHLDFIYGEEDGRTFLPFDGQRAECKHDCQNERSKSLVLQSFRHLHP